MATTETKLSADHITMAFQRDGKTTPVLNDITLEVAQGEFLCIVGPSGCGKSTLLSAMAGFLSPSSGEIRIDGQVVTGPTLAGFLFSRSAAFFRG